MEGVERGFDAAMCVGYHAMAGTGTPSSTTPIPTGFTRCGSTGARWASSALNAAVAGTFGVPVAMVSGDQALAAEARGARTRSRRWW